MLNYAMTYPGKFPPKFELSNSSHARKAEESFAMHTIIQSEWCPAAPRAKFPSAFRNFWPTAKISTPAPFPTPFSPRPQLTFPLFPPSFLPSFLSYSRFLALAVSHPIAGVAMVFFKDLSSCSSSSSSSFTTRVCLSSLSRAITWNEGFLPSGPFEPFLPLVAP